MYQYYCVLKKGKNTGLGVDQMLEVQLVGADGSYITANNQTTSVLSSDGTKIEIIENNELFWACRGGGAGPWGVVTAMTIKLHKPRDECTEECYIVNNVVWASNYFAGRFTLLQPSSYSTIFM